MTARTASRPRPVQIAVATVIAVLLVGLPPLLPGGGGGFTVTNQLVPLAFADEGDGVWVSSTVPGRPTVAGLTWEDDAPDQAWVRSRGGEGWSDWSPIEVEDEHVPDGSRPEGSGPEHASAPIIVTGAEELQFRVEADARPEQMQASVVRVDGELESRSVRGAASADAAPSRPAMVMRSQWGGDDCLRADGKTSDPDYVDQVQVMFVHHTAGSNSYSRARSPAIVRGICDYHVRIRDYDDIAYNFLIDRYGTIYEGRGGGVAAGVMGAHTGGFNSYSTGVSFMGTHATTPPNSAAQTALRNLASWKLDVHHVDPTGVTYLRSLGSSKYSSGRTVRMANVSGHRDASSTSCPGTACYNLLPTFRTQIRAHGGPKLFDGRPDADPVSGSQAAGYATVEFAVGATPAMPMTFEIRDRNGQVLERSRASGSSAVFTWDGRSNGRTVPAGTYRVHVTGQPSSGAAPRAIDHTFRLGAYLPPFVDDDGSRFEVDISWIAREGITKGCNPPTNNRYCPGDDVTRGEMAAFLSRAFDLRETSRGGSFADVPSDSTFAVDINKLATAGITRGCNPPANTRYCPGDAVTRAEMAAFLARAKDLTRTSSAGRFVDVPSDSTFAVDINKLATDGITKGCNPPTNNRYCPGDDVTRGEMAAFLRRALQD